MNFFFGQAGKVSGLPSSLSPAAVDLLKKLLDPDPTTRITAEAALQHPWIGGEVELGQENLGESMRGFKTFARISKVGPQHPKATLDLEGKEGNEVVGCIEGS